MKPKQLLLTLLALLGSMAANADGFEIEDLSELSNNRQYLIHTRNENRGSLGVTDNHLASTNPAAWGPWVCRPVVLDKDNPLITNLNQLSSPYTEPTEGSLAAMIDGDTETFWHSVWSQGTVEAGSHYFQVEMLNQANMDVAFKVTRRQTASNHITEWGVYGTNNANATKANCTKLAVIKTPCNNSSETRVSDIFNTGGYKYLRFYINRTTGGNFGHLAEFQLYPATYDEAHGDASPFAIIEKDGGYYLYSVLDKAFITYVNNGDENAYPWQFTDNKMDIYKHNDYFVFDFIDTEYTINVNENPGISISNYGTLTNKFDDGNLFTIEEVGYFDPTEALAKFDAQKVNVTYNVMYEGNLVATATEEVASGEPLPSAPASLDNAFVTLTKTGTYPTTVTEDVTVTYNATWNGPFVFTKTLSGAKWYNMNIRSGYYVGKQESEPYYPTWGVDEATLATPAYQWAFGGDPYHVKIYNRTTALNETLTKDGDNAVMRSDDYSWDLLPNNGGFVLRVQGTDYCCINQFGSTSGPLQFWTSSKALTDDGSTFRVEEVVETSPGIEFADANVKALCVDNWDTNGDGKLSEEEAAAVTSLGTVFREKTNITSFNELQYFTRLTSIGDEAFWCCSNLASITFPESLTSIGGSAFTNCSGLTSVTLPESITSIEGYAFYDCYSLTSINIPSSVTSIGRYAFSYCRGLTSITIPNSVTSIGVNAFSYCSGLTSITIPNSVTSIGDGAFDGCSSLTSINIPSSVTSLGKNAFSYCTNLSSAIIGCTNLGDGAFSCCEALTSATIKKSVTNIGSAIFSDCPWFTSIIVENGNPVYDSRNYCNAIIESATNTLIAGCQGTMIPNSVTSIGEMAFYHQSLISGIWIPASVTSIGNLAFADCDIPVVYCDANNVPDTQSNAFVNSNIDRASLYVPVGSLNAYRTTVPWSGFARIWPIGGMLINDEMTSLYIPEDFFNDPQYVIFTHNFTGDWEALYLPFAIDYDAIKADFDLAEIDGVVQNDDDNDGIADFTVLSIMGFKGQMTEPNTPYLIRAKNSGEQTIVFDDVTLYPIVSASIDCSSTSIRYEFTGSYNTLNASALANRYVVQGGELVKGASSLAPCRWYMTATARKGTLNLPNRIRIMPVEDVITGVSSLEETEEGAAVYNLAGQRLNKVQKGIYIVNGKKVLIK